MRLLAVSSAVLLLSRSLVVGAAAFTFFPIDAIQSTRRRSHRVVTRGTRPFQEYKPLWALGRGGASDEESLTPREGALVAMRKCYRTTFLMVAVDIWTKLLPDPRGGWDILMASRPSSWLDVADAASSLSLLAFGAGLWGVTRSYEKIAAAETDDEDVNNLAVGIMSSYKWMYLTTGWVMVGLSMRLADKVFSNNGIAPALVGLLAVCGSLYARVTVSSETDGAVGKAVNQAAVDMRNLGIEAAQNMGFCSVSFIIFAVLRILFWYTAILPSDLPILIRCLLTNKFLNLFAVGILMQPMAQRFLAATMKVTNAGNAGRIERQDTIFSELKEAEAGFYGKVAQVLLSSTIVDILLYGIPLILGK